MSSTSTRNEPPVEDHPFLHAPQELIAKKREMRPLETSFQNEARAIAEEAIARCVYACGLTFNVVRSPYWQKMVRSINEAPKGFNGPGYEKVHTTLLDKEVINVKASMQPIKDSWFEIGVTIVSNGWKDARNCPLLNVIVVSTRGAMFLKAVDCEGEVKDSLFIANILIQAIEQVGPQNVVQVIIDNAKNYTATSLLVEECFKHIFWTPCAMHSLNLMLQKIGTKIEWIKKMYEEAQEFPMFVTNHHMMQAIFRQFSKLELLKVASSLSSERNWSTCSFIHSIKRNQLNSKKADNLVFVHSNLRLTTHKDNTYKKGEAQQWDVEPKFAELEAHFDALAIDDGDCKLLSDVEADPKAGLEAASTDASGTVCASNLQQHNDDDLFDDILIMDD